VYIVIVLSDVALMDMVRVACPLDTFQARQHPHEADYQGQRQMGQEVGEVP
jgi:hypothetical protein